MLFGATLAAQRFLPSLDKPDVPEKMTYSVGGRQYLAIGAGGVTKGTGLLPLTPELTTPTGGNTLFLFFRISAEIGYELSAKREEPRPHVHFR